MATIPYPSKGQTRAALYRASIPAVWRFLRTQPASFWLINIYLFLEYVRPQTVWPSLSVFPWAEAVLILTPVMMLVEGKLPRLPTIIGPLLVIYSVVVVISSFTAVNPAASYAGWKLYFSWVLIFILITNIVTTEKRYFIFILAFLLYSLKMSQHGFRSWMGNGFGFSSWGVTGAPGWFQNSGEFGIQMCIFLPLSVEFIFALRSYWRKWTRYFFYLLPITAVASIVASSSRGALVGLAAVGLWWVARSKHRGRAISLVVVLGILTWTVVPPQQKARLAESGEDGTSVARIDRWEAGIQMSEQYPVLGIGYNNWSTYYGPLPHNIFIQALAEMGYTGFLAFLSLIAATFAVNYKTRRLLEEVSDDTGFLRHMAFGLDGALIGFMASGFFVTVLYYPFFWINLAMTVSLHIAARNTRLQNIVGQNPPVSLRPLHATTP